jgi:hypothetical protein
MRLLQAIMIRRPVRLFLFSSHPTAKFRHQFIKPHLRALLVRWQNIECVANSSEVHGRYLSWYPEFLSANSFRHRNTLSTMLAETGWCVPGVKMPYPPQWQLFPPSALVL